LSRRDGTRVPRRRRRLVWPVLVSLVFVGILFVGVFPTQTYLGQKREAQALRDQLADLEAHNDRLEARANALQDDDAIELLARKEWGLVYPGEEAYAIVGLEPPVDVPDAWPFDRVEKRLEADTGD
jgi:cell division protein FtsB